MSKQNATFPNGLIIKEHITQSDVSVLNVSINVVEFVAYLKDNYNKDQNGMLWSNIKIIPRKSITKGGLTHTAIKDEYYSTKSAEKEFEEIASEFLFEEEKDENIAQKERAIITADTAEPSDKRTKAYKEWVALQETSDLPF
tara:strand:+ start:3006 stop:3431 length:426 start_codon:yes stop_codon:yes gene_type:complete